jgi:hypothetical protein
MDNDEIGTRRTVVLAKQRALTRAVAVNSRHSTNWLVHADCSGHQEMQTI